MRHHPLEWATELLELGVIVQPGRLVPATKSVVSIEADPRLSNAGPNRLTNWMLDCEPNAIQAEWLEHQQARWSVPDRGT